MKKIDKVILKNFKFFHGTETLNFDSKNILIFGENGSGKSSLYWGLYTFLQSSLKDDESIKKYFDKNHKEKLINLFADDSDSSFLKLTLKDNDNVISTYEISYALINTNKADTTIKKANLASDFINYRLLSRLYQFKNSEDIDLFGIFEDEILAFITLENENFDALWKTLKAGLNPRPTMSSSIYTEFQNKIDFFNTRFKVFLENVNRTANSILKDNFSEQIKVFISYENTTYDDFVEGSTTKRNHKTIAPKINLTVKFIDDTYILDKPHTFLNEAKLTAIALAIRFAILKQRLSLDNVLKILVLDDLLISLDMTHRVEVINFLLNDTDLKDYQQIILTHDRAFFELAKNKFDNLPDNTWEYFEMYENASDDIPKPLIMHSDSHFERAVKYFKLCDYPASGNYLRKASEETIKCKVLDTFRPSDKDGLDRTIQNYEVMCKEFNIPIDDNIGRLKEFTKRVFNPSSHDDLISPLYKKEVKDAIEVVSNLINLPKIEHNETKIKKGSVLTFKYNEKYEIIYTFLGDVPLYTFGDDILNRDSILLYKFKHKLFVNDEWEEHLNTNNTIFTLKEVYQRVKHFVNEQFVVEIDVEAFISSLLIDDSHLLEDIKKLFRKQCL